MDKFNLFDFTYKDNPAFRFKTLLNAMKISDIWAFFWCSFEITAIDKDDRYSRHERIRKVRLSGNGFRSGPVLETDDVIFLIQYDKSRIKFFVKGSFGKPADVVVAFHDDRPYIKTVNDWEFPNNLLSLPEIQ